MGSLFVKINRGWPDSRCQHQLVEESPDFAEQGAR